MQPSKVRGQVVVVGSFVGLATVQEWLNLCLSPLKKILFISLTVLAAQLGNGPLDTGQKRIVPGQILGSHFIPGRNRTFS